MSACGGQRQLRVENHTPRTLYFDPPFATDYEAGRTIRPGGALVTTDGVTVSSYLEQTTLGAGGGLYVLRPGAPASRAALQQAVSGTGFRFGFLVQNECAQGQPEEYRSGRLLIRARTDGSTVTVRVLYDAYWAEAAFITLATVLGVAAVAMGAAALWGVRNPDKAGPRWLSRQRKDGWRTSDKRMISTDA